MERVSEVLGGQIGRNSQQERELALRGKVVVSRETEGRQGKDPTGKAKTR